jgi:predicted branched-subunit amino acid permease
VTFGSYPLSNAPDNLTPEKPTLTWAGAVIGARTSMPLTIFTIAYGLAFGAIAAEKGLTAFQAASLSALTFAGTSQFVAMDFWVDPINFLAMMLAVFAISARHILMGATLYPWMKLYSPWIRYLSAVTLVDPSWAFAMQEYEKGKRDLGLFLGGATGLWLGWVFGTYIGVALGSTLADPKDVGIDTLIVTYFACLILGLWKGKGRSLLPWSVAGVCAMLGYWFLPSGWHIMAGGFAGGLVAYVTYRDEVNEGDSEGSEEVTNG